MPKRHRKEYKHPLPVRVIEVPPVFIGNPLSLTYAAVSFLGQLFFSSAPRRTVAVEYVDGAFKVADPDEMRYLWECGFFGKGSLSRSEPTFQARAEHRLLGRPNSQISKEEISNYRRRLRKQYKEKRKVLDKQMRECTNSDTLAELQKESDALGLERVRIGRAKPPAEQHKETKMTREESLLISEDGLSVRQVEYLELLPYEAVFLSYLGTVKDSSAAGTLKQMVPTVPAANDPLLLRLAAYVHYRSLGWCARTGLKFSCDFVLYPKGPPFHHARYAVNVLDDKSVPDWTQSQGVDRVVSGVKKTLILCYVTAPSQAELERVWGTNFDLPDLVNMYGLQEVSYNRWIPDRTRN